MPFLAWPLIRHKGTRGSSETKVVSSIKSLFFYLFSREFIFQRENSSRFFHIQFIKFQIPVIGLLCCILASSAARGQDVGNSEDDDPFIDPDAASEALQPAERTESSLAYMLGIGYGLNPIIILAPAVSVGMYLDPVVIGVEISDSEHLGIWEKERRENFGTSRFSGETQFVKWFFGDNFYLMAAREHRTLKLWNRTYNRTGLGKALFDMHYDLTLASLGVGLLRFNSIGFLAIDIIRFGFPQKKSVEIVEHWETWSINSGTREPLDKNIQKRQENWVDILDSPTGLFATFGFYF